MKPKQIKKIHTLIDVRTPTEFKTEHIEGSINIPLDTLKGQIKGIKNAVLVCGTGVRAGKACKYIEAPVMEGGLSAWKKAGLKTVKSGWAIERQVRLIAGLIVITGIGLTYYNPAWKYLALFVGIGLAYAAITDSCMMGYLLMKMPWNK